MCEVARLRQAGVLRGRHQVLNLLHRLGWWNRAGEKATLPAQFRIMAPFWRLRRPVHAYAVTVVFGRPTEGVSGGFPASVTVTETQTVMGTEGMVTRPTVAVTDVPRVRFRSW